MVNYLLIKFLSLGLTFTSESDSFVQPLAFDSAPKGALTCANVREITGHVVGSCTVRAMPEFFACHTKGECATTAERKRWVSLVDRLSAVSARVFVFSTGSGESTAYVLGKTGTSVVGIVTGLTET